jgi:hypothetical protein
MPYTKILRGHYSNTTVLNVHASVEDKTDDMDSFCKKLECVFNQIPKYHMEILLGDFNVKVCIDNILKLT